MFRRINIRSRLRIISNHVTLQAGRVFALRQSGLRPVSLTARIDAMQSPAREVCRECYDLFAEALIIPNKWLPKRLRNGKTSGATPASIFRELRSRIERKAETESVYAALKADKADRVARYRESCEHPDGIEYDLSREELIRKAERSFARMFGIRPE